MTDLSTPEPDPIPNDNPSIHDLLIEDLKEFSCYSVLIPDILDRKEFGLKKHGTILQINNCRNHLNDAYQESCDAIIYLKQEIVKSGLSDDLRMAFYSACALAVAIKRLLEKPVQETSYSVLGDK
jgi:hypothetical protein